MPDDSASGDSKGLVPWSRDILNRGLGTARTSLYSTFSLLRRHKVPLYALHLAYFGTTATAMGLALWRPQLQADAWARTNAQLESPSGRFVLSAYDSKNKNIPLAAAVTFVVNVLVGAFGVITLPSFVLPFSGVAMALYRAAQWGLLFSPVTPESVTVWHFITLLVEGEAYVLAATATWLQSVDVFRQYFPTRTAKIDGEDKQDKQDKEEKPEEGKNTGWSIRLPDLSYGWQVTKQFYKPITWVLAVAAVWEAYEVMFLPGPVKGA